MAEPIRVTMEVARVQTLADGGTRWTFDLSEGHALESATLIVCKEQGALLEATLTPKFRDDAVNNSVKSSVNSWGR
jgi:hypothetical protein